MKTLTKLLLLLIFTVPAIAADFDGDGKQDIAVFRPSEGNWYVLRADNTFYSVHWGTGGDIPLTGDVDGDGKDDFVVYRPVQVGNLSSMWWILYSNGNGASGAANGVSFGQPTDTPILADFNGDGKADLVIYRGGRWFVWDFYSGGGITTAQFGLSTDIPIR